MMESNAADYDHIADLVDKSLKGERDAFETLVRMHLRTAVTVALAVTGRVVDAEDVAQDAFVLAHRKLASCNDPRRFSGWLLQIVRNQAINWVNRRNRHERHVTRDLEMSIPETVEAGAISRQLLLAALTQLDTTQREIVLLHEMEGWTHDEIASFLKMTPETCRWQLFQARRTMTLFLERSANPRKKVNHE